MALDAVARHRSFNAAADELGYTQSAVSQQIVVARADRRAPGVRALARAAARSSPTEVGRVLLGHAQAVLARVEAAVAPTLTALVEGAVGELRVGTYQSVATRLLPVVLARFRALWPRIDVQLFESGSHDEIDGRVERGRARRRLHDAADPERGPVRYTGLLSDPYLLVVAPRAPARLRRPPAGLRALAEHDLIGYRVCRAHARVERHLRDHGHRAARRHAGRGQPPAPGARGPGRRRGGDAAAGDRRSTAATSSCSTCASRCRARELGLRLAPRGRELIGRPARDFIELATEAGAELAEEVTPVPAARCQRAACRERDGERRASLRERAVLGLDAGRDAVEEARDLGLPRVARAP